MICKTEEMIELKAAQLYKRITWRLILGKNWTTFYCAKLRWKNLGSEHEPLKNGHHDSLYVGLHVHLHVGHYVGHLHVVSTP